jgi:hypothetical protein
MQGGGRRGQETLVEGDELAAHLLTDLPRIVTGADLEVGAQQLDHGQVRGGHAIGDGGALDDEAVVRARRVDELPEEAGLADAGLADDADELAVAGVGPLEGVGEAVQLGRAADEPGEAPGRRGLQAGARGAGADDLVDLDWLGETLHGHGAQRLDLDEAFGQTRCVGGHQDGAGHGHLLHAGGEVGGLADGGVVHAQIAADRAHHDLARVQADADLERDPGPALDVLGVAPHRLLHPEGGAAGAHGVVLEGKGGAEEGHDAVAHDLIDGSLVVMDGLHHPLEHGIEELARLLGVALGEQLHRALHVGEEDGHLLALARVGPGPTPLEGRLRGEDLLGEVARGIGPRRGVMSLARNPRTERLPALQAELRPGRQLGATGRTREREARAALEAELGPGWILMLTPGTAHAGASRWPGWSVRPVRPREYRTVASVPARTPVRHDPDPLRLAEIQGVGVAADHVVWPGGDGTLKEPCRGTARVADRSGGQGAGAPERLPEAANALWRSWSGISSRANRRSPIPTSSADRAGDPDAHRVEHASPRLDLRLEDGDALTDLLEGGVL